mmetsp:Transcript_4601/g.10159  ORF Transcript_4601/g.10159 Transcript_4601/m.10159 type:complete len:203 (+) Transcript_4601:1-609(+)
MSQSGRWTVSNPASLSPAGRSTRGQASEGDPTAVMLSPMRNYSRPKASFVGIPMTPAANADLQSPGSVCADVLQALEAQREALAASRCGPLDRTHLAQENKQLRKLLDEEMFRRFRMEEDFARFREEGVFDLVNSVCKGQAARTSDVVTALMALVKDTEGPRMMSPAVSQNSPMSLRAGEPGDAQSLLSRLEAPASVDSPGR